MLTPLISVLVTAAVLLGAPVLLAMCFRTVVSTNDMHIVQTGKKTVSYGKDMAAGNVYWSWPSWVPVIGIKVGVLPVSVFNATLNGYDAYDKGRVPFKVDIMAFFRITDSDVAAQRVRSPQELSAQLQGVLQGACRTILASHDIESILEGRSTFGQQFTAEVDGNLKEWGVQSVKMIELMDIRDADGSQVIHNIMAKKKSYIEMQSRTAVAENNRAASIAEVEAKRNVDVSKQEAEQVVGLRTAEKEREVGIAAQVAAQAIKEQEKVTTERHMDVVKVGKVREAEILREVQVVTADQDRQTTVIKADGAKQQTVIAAEGQLRAAELNAQGVVANGEAKGKADTAVLMAPVTTQIALAKEIATNDSYQKYLIAIQSVEKDKIVGVAQAQALQKADIKVIANTGDAPSGISSVGELFSTAGGTKLASAVEAFAQSPTGKALISKVTG